MLMLKEKNVNKTLHVNKEKSRHRRRNPPKGRECCKVTVRSDEKEWKSIASRR